MFKQHSTHWLPGAVVGRAQEKKIVWPRVSLQVRAEPQPLPDEDSSSPRLRWRLAAQVGSGWEPDICIVNQCLETVAPRSLWYLVPCGILSISSHLSDLSVLTSKILVGGPFRSATVLLKEMVSY